MSDSEEQCPPKKIDTCYCYEKFKENLPSDFVPNCFKWECANYRKNNGDATYDRCYDKYIILEGK